MKETGQEPVKLSNSVYQAIKTDIVTNRLKQGDAISENALSKKYNMSRTPIREAVQLLAAEGLIEVGAGKSSLVKSITKKEVYDLYEIRDILECAAVSTSLSHITKEEIHQMYDEWIAVKKLVAEGQDNYFDQIFKMDSKLHALLVEKCDNDYLKSLMNQIKSNITRMQHISLIFLNRPEESIDNHLEMIDCISKRDPGLLKEVLHKHFISSAHDITDSPILDQAEGD